MEYQIVHSVTGRCRFRIPQLAQHVEFADRLSELVNSLEFVTGVRVNPKAASLVVNYEKNTIAVVQASVASCIQKAGNTAIAHRSTNSTVTALSKETEPSINHWQDLGFPVLSVGVALFAAPLELPAIVVITAIAGAALPWFSRAAESLSHHHQPNIDLLDSAWIALQTAQGQYIAPALKTCLVEARRSLRGSTLDQQQQRVSEQLAWLVQLVQAERDGRTLNIVAKDLVSGDRVKVKVGEMIPVDGWVLEGTGLIDESTLNREGNSVVCLPGQAVYAGTIVLAGELKVLAERTGMETRSSLVAQIIQTQPVHDTQIGSHQAELVKTAIVPTLLFGSTVFAFTGNLSAAISAFQLDFGSGIPISVHTTLLSALTYAARHGIYIRSAGVLELLAQLDAVVFNQDFPDLPSSDAINTVLLSLHHQGIVVYDGSSLNSSTPVDCATYLVKGLQHQGKTVATVGVAEILPADITIAFRQQALQYDADIVIESWQELIYAIRIAKRAMDLVHQNTALILLPNLLMQIGGGMFLGVNPVWNVMVNNGSAFFAEFVNGTCPFETDDTVEASVKLSGAKRISCDG
jgi:cation transport ATPase